MRQRAQFEGAQIELLALLEPQPPRREELEGAAGEGLKIRHRHVDGRVPAPRHRLGRRGDQRRARDVLRPRRQLGARGERGAQRLEPGAVRTAGQTALDHALGRRRAEQRVALRRGGQRGEKRPQLSEEDRGKERRPFLILLGPRDAQVLARPREGDGSQEALLAGALQAVPVQREARLGQGGPLRVREQRVLLDGPRELPFVETRDDDGL